ncbi:hypothetical protein OESDEN_20848 [Oesophagostomum dentatum]|uniref:Uncharacterized protein n=1 Tax=Oesophagostomum dentatum TaxID=61180 RepID=A0A0B1S7K9_OESDE|nr:hypothetical protein OESDEN_20848 [Oesophagostomum dentatum]
MMATMIPSALMVIIMLANRITSLNYVMIMGLPATLIVLYGFLGLTLSPARLYDEVNEAIIG